MCRDCKNGKLNGEFHHGHHPHRQEGGSFMQGAVFGAIIGAVLGLLYAPAKGTETQKKVKKTADKIRGRVEPIVDEIKEKGGPVVEQLREDAGPMMDRFKAKINETLEDIDDSVKKQTKHRKGFFKK